MRGTLSHTLLPPPPRHSSASLPLLSRRYNKAHYDKDNPPPRTVQGYMFNVFYPDLIDRQRTPGFHLEPCLDSDDFVLIVFKGAPPYEPLAFKIVNKEWNYARKHGFRCVFDRGVLQLHFNFQRARYRS